MSRIRRRSGSAVTEYCGLIGFRPSMIIQVGVGINCGEWDCFQDAWKDVPVLAFEANPEIYQSLLPAVPDNYQIVNRAVTDQMSGFVTLYGRSRHRDGSTIHDRSGEVDRNWKVEQTRLDEWLQHIPNLENLLWLDCEGAELLALKGGEHMLKHVAMINVELTGNPRVDTWCKPGEVHALLSRAGFVQVWTHTHRSCIGQFDAIYVRDRYIDHRFTTNPQLLELQ